MLYVYVVPNFIENSKRDFLFYLFIIFEASDESEAYTSDRFDLLA